MIYSKDKFKMKDQTVEVLLCHDFRYDKLFTYLMMNILELNSLVKHGYLIRALVALAFVIHVNC